MSQPELPIEVEPETGIWKTDGLPMIYVPRHFFVNNHTAVEVAMGREAYRQILTPAGDKSALFWCEAEARTHGLQPGETFRHYMRRLSQRGWGQFGTELLDPVGGRAEIHLHHSVFPLHLGHTGRCECYMFEGFITGAFRYVRQAGDGRSEIRCEETHCVSAGDPFCRFMLSSPVGEFPAARGSDSPAEKVELGDGIDPDRRLIRGRRS